MTLAGAPALAPRGMRRAVPWIGALLIVAIVAMAAWDVVRGHRAAEDEAGRQLETQARILAEQTARSVQAVDVVLRHVAAEYKRGRLARLSRDELHQYLRELSVGLEQIDGFGMYDAKGDVVAVSWDSPAELPTIAELPGFRALRDNPNIELGIGDATRTASGDGWRIPIGRRLETPDGEFAGVIGARGRVSYYQGFYRDVRPEGGTAITLMHARGTLLARHPPVEGQLGRRFEQFDRLAGERAGSMLPNRALVQRVERQPAAGRAVSPVDGVDRFGVLRWVPDYPLAVVVTRDAALALAGWREQALGTALRTAALAVLAAWLLGLLVRQLGRLDRVRESLEAQKNRFALAVAGSDDGIWDWDKSTRMIFTSARARELFGQPPGPETQPMDEWFAALRFHPDDVPRRRQAVADHLAGRTPSYEGEYRVQHPDGQYRWVRVRGVCLRDADGHPLRMAGSVSDIDQRKRAEDALRESEQRYQIAMTGSNEGHWVWDVNTDALFASPSLYALFGLPPEPPLRTSAEFFARVPVHPDDRAELQRALSEHLDGRSAFLDIEYRITRADDGTERWIHSRGQCFRDAVGKPLRVAGASVDVTERRRAEDALRRSEERFALAVAGTNDGILDWESADDRMYISPRALEILGLPADTQIASEHDWQTIVLPRFHPDDAAKLAEPPQGPECGHDGEYRVRDADGNYRWTRLRGRWVSGADGKPVRWAGSISDIDARKRAEQALRTSEERYALAMAGLHGGHWVWEVATDALFGSGTLNELFGLPADLQPTTRTDYFQRVNLYPADRERAEQVIRELTAKATRADWEYRVVLPDGNLRWITTRAQSFANAAGKVVRVAGVSVDATARKRTEEALRVSEERYALAVAGSDDGVWDWDFRANLAFESQRARELQGLPPGPELQPLPDLLESLRVHPEDAPRRAEGIRAHLAGETPAYECEYRVRHDDVGYKWVRIRALCIRDADGQPVRMAGSVSDIDARKRAEEALRRSEERFALAVAGANDGILDWDIVHDRLFASPRAMQLVGLQPSDGDALQTRDQWAALVMPRFHPDDRLRLREELKGSRDDPPDAHEGEYRLRGADGEYRWLRFRGRTVRDANGKALRWAGSVSDVDALKRAEEALRRSEERYQLAVLGSNEGLWDWDLRADTLFLSPRAQALLWEQVDEPLKPRRYWIDRTPYHPDDVGRVRQAIAAHLRGATGHYEVEYRVRHHNGQWRWYRQRGVAVRDADGRPYRMAGSMEDITRRKEAEADRDRLEAQLRQSQKLEAMGTLAGGIAHDFNNILAAILGYGEMAQKDAAEGSAQRRHLEAALSAGMRAKSLVERILAFSRSGMGERAPVHVQSVLGEALDAVAGSLPRGVELQRDVELGNAAVLGDATQIHQVVMNLVANAAQAIRGDGVVAVRARTLNLQEALSVCTAQLAAGAYLRVDVSDTGSGIAPNLLERIFDPFFTTKQVGVGTGLGLSLVHGIVADLGGGIDVHSTVGAGSTFTVYLPWSGCVAAPQAEAPVPVTNGDGETILLVDDEEALVRLGEEMLAELGYEPVGFASSRAAIETFRASPERFDAVLSDEAMPELTGSELAREIRRIRPDIPIVLMTGYATPALAARAREAGVAEVLAKPLVASDIARSLAGALRRAPGEGNLQRTGAEDAESAEEEKVR